MVALKFLTLLDLYDIYSTATSRVILWLHIKHFSSPTEFSWSLISELYIMCNVYTIGAYPQTKQEEIKRWGG